MKISIGADHAGFDVRETLVKYLKEKGIEVVDHGTHSKDSVDYPDFAHAVAKDVAHGIVDCGILICSTGIGISIAANKVKGIRAGLVHNEESASLCKRHNNANILCMGQMFVPPELAKKLVDIYLSSKFEEGRHCRRVDKIEEDLT